MGGRIGPDRHVDREGRTKSRAGAARLVDPIGGAFGQYINIEKAIQLGLLPDVPWDRFQFLGNTSVKGAYMALLSRTARGQIAAAAAKMTYLELSADNAFYDNFTSALFLPHTEIARFPSVQAILTNGRNNHPEEENRPAQPEETPV